MEMQLERGKTGDTMSQKADQPGTCLGPLDPDHEGRGECGQQVLPTGSQAVP